MRSSSGRGDGDEDEGGAGVGADHAEGRQQRQPGDCFFVVEVDVGDLRCFGERCGAQADGSDGHGDGAFEFDQVGARRFVGEGQC